MIVATHLLLFVSVFAWTQTRSITPVQPKKKTPAITFLRFSGTSEATKLSRSRMPSPPPALTRSERISAIALARKTGNIQARSLDAEPRAHVVLTPAAPVSGPNHFDLNLGYLYFNTNPTTGALSSQHATLIYDDFSYFSFELAVIPGKTYLADFHVSAEPGYWIISSGRVEARINSENQHLLVAFRAENQSQTIVLRKPNMMLIEPPTGPSFFRLELTQID